VKLAAGIVTELVATQFPDLAAGRVRRFGAGWDHELFAVGTEWIFRFPRRAERVAWLTREIEILAVAGETLGSSIPCFELLGTPSATFPYPFVGYRPLPGIGADRTSTPNLTGLAEDIGRLLSKLHRIDPGRIPATPAGWEHESWHELQAELAAAAGLVRPLLSSVLLTEAESYLGGRIPVPAQDGPRRFIHNDVCPDHLIVDPRSGRLIGLIDFTDAMTGEPVLDFAGLIGIGGYRFINHVLARYDLPLGEGFHAKLNWLTRTLTLTWLAEAAAHCPPDIPKHLTWTARAFGR
jgi:aminoglycoside phosphotransferase (APT) family kinase protein